MSKKLEEKRLRREAEERRHEEAKRAKRNRNLITLAIAVAVAVLVGYLVMSERSEEESFESVSASQAGCTDIEELSEDPPREHVEEGSPVQYETTPPTGGNHYGTPASAGFSESPLEPERVVHNLEHGQVVVWYSPDAPGATIDSLETYVGNAGIGMVATPYDQVPDNHSFTLTAWGAMQSCDEVSEEVLNQFRNRYQGRGPEQVGIPTVDL